MTVGIRTAVILVGGSGLRLRPLTNDIPKCMIPVHGKPLIYWTLTWLKESGFEHAVLGVSYLKEKVIQYVSENQKTFGLKVDFSEHSQDGETGEGFRLAIKRHVTDEDFLAMNGDELTNLNLKNFVDFHYKNKGTVTVAVSPMRSPFAIIETNGADITSFSEKPILQDKLVSIGIYVFNHRITSDLPAMGSIEKTTFPVLASKNLIKAYRLSGDERWLTINSLKDLYTAEQEFASLRRSDSP
jgi:mannose-1-phosphate guanylyltransferase